MQRTNVTSFWVVTVYGTLTVVVQVSFSRKIGEQLQVVAFADKPNIILPPYFRNGGTIVAKDLIKKKDFIRKLTMTQCGSCKTYWNICGCAKAYLTRL